jgi:acyl-CoA synthetase (AMP-forming)/AMP-acid ligase II
MTGLDERVPAQDVLERSGGNLAGLAHWAMSTFGDKEAVRLETGEVLSFRQLARRTAGIVEQLAGHGIGQGDAIAVVLGSCSALPLHIIAAAHLGAIVVPVNPTFTSAELAHVLTLTEPTMLVTTAEYSTANGAVLAQHSVRVRVLDDAGRDPDLSNEADPDQLGSTPMLDLPVRFGLTSGSTGMSKAVVKTQRQWMRDGHALATALELRPEDRVLSAQPLYYGDPFMLLMACLQTGASCVFLERFRSGTFMEQVGRYEATKFVTIGSMPAMLLNTDPSPTDRAHHAVGAWSVGVPPHLHAELEERFGLPWYELYGLSETGLVLGQSPHSTREVGSGWLGEPAPDMAVRLVDDDGTVVDGDGLGVLEVKGPTVVSGYHNKPDATAEAVNDGWFRTGDVLERRGQQYRYVRRIKDIVRRSGENLSCQEIEAALRDCDGVVDAAVLPRPDELRGEEVWAFVQLEPTGPQPPDWRQHADRLAELAGLRLAPRKVPRFVTFVDRLERTPSERIVKRHLVERADPARTVDLGEKRGHDTARP